MPGRKRSRVGPVPSPAAHGGPNNAYEIAYYMRHKEDDSDQAVPGQEFLNSVPPAVSARIRAVVIAVAEAPPHKFAGGGKWEAMSGDMAGIYEVRVDGPPNRTHYRLFCVLDTKALDPEGKPCRPMLVIIDGAAKPFKTQMPNGVYANVRKLRDEYLKRERRSLA